MAMTEAFHTRRRSCAGVLWPSSTFVVIEFVAIRFGIVALCPLADGKTTHKGWNSTVSRSHVSETNLLQSSLWTFPVHFYNQSKIRMVSCRRTLRNITLSTFLCTNRAIFSPSLQAFLLSLSVFFNVSEAVFNYSPKYQNAIWWCLS